MKVHQIISQYKVGSRYTYAHLIHITYHRSHAILNDFEGRNMSSNTVIIDLCDSSKLSLQHDNASAPTDKPSESPPPFAGDICFHRFLVETTPRFLLPQRIICGVIVLLSVIAIPYAVASEVKYSNLSDPNQEATFLGGPITALVTAVIGLYSRNM
jgi:hypothetical protein